MSSRGVRFRWHMGRRFAGAMTGWEVNVSFEAAGTVGMEEASEIELSPACVSVVEQKG